MNTPVEQRLRTLPELDPPADAWERVLARHRRSHRPLGHRLLVGLATAACAATVAALVIGLGIRPWRVDPAPTADTAMTVPPVPTDVEIQRLRARSQELERMLRGLPPGPNVVRANTAMAIADLEDQLAVLDYQLNRAAGRPDQDPRALWQQRVELMDRLLRVRYTEAGAEGF